MTTTKPCICRGTGKLEVHTPDTLSMFALAMTEAEEDAIDFKTEMVQCWECVTESQMLAAVRDAAKLGGWLTYHTYDSRRSEPGFPDLVLVRPPVILFLELKGPKGRISDAQRRWVAAINRSRYGHHSDFGVDYDKMVIHDGIGAGPAAEIVHPKRLHHLVRYLAQPRPWP